MRLASASNSPGVTATSCTQATTPNVPMPPKRQPLLGQIYGLTLSAIGRVKRGRQPGLARLKKRLEQVYESNNGDVEVCLYSVFRDPFTATCLVQIPH